MERLKNWLDVSAAAAAFSSFMGWLPTLLSVVASLLSIVWLCMQIHDRLEKRKHRTHAR